MAGLQKALNHRDSSHASDALVRLNKLRQEGILCDVTILVQGKEFKAHKAVMAACSDYFLNALCGGKTTAMVSVDRNAGHMTVELEHVTVRGFTPLIEYAYTSNLHVNPTDVLDVLQAASFMQMPKVSSACSEYVRSHMWSQNMSHLAGIPGLPANLLSAPGKSKEDDINRAVAAAAAMAAAGSRGITPDVSSLFSSSISAAAGRALGQPPMLIPMRSIGYEAGLQQWAATMAGTQSFLSRVSQGNNRLSSAETLSPSVANNSTLTAITTHSKSPNRQWSSPKSADKRATPSPKENEQQLNGRDSERVKMETQSDDETHQNSSIKEASSPAGSNASEPLEDSWQALQKLYSMRANGAASPKDGNPNHRSRSNTPVDLDRNNNIPSPLSRDNSRPHSAESPYNIANNNSNNNNNSNIIRNEGMNSFINKMKAGLLSSDPTMARLSPATAAAAAAAMAAGRAMPVSSMQNALLQQQQLLAQHRTNSRSPDNDALPIPELPVVPPNGQYMSVRRRTLQSNVPKPHQCQICGSRFTRFHNLKQHIKLHSGIKPYECDECGKRFTRNYTLRLHKMKHVGLRNFRCGTCDATFTSLGEFRAHLRITMHSHAPGTPGLENNPTRPGSAEPEDLSSGISMSQKLAIANARARYSAYDPSVLGIGATSVDGQVNGANRPAFNGNMDDRGSVGGDSPQISERSLSPQDLSTKHADENNEKNGDFQENEKEFNDVNSDMTMDDRAVREINGDFKEHNNRCASMSPQSDRFVSSGTESANKSAGEDAEEQDLVIDHPEEVTENDRPMSLVVNASA